MFNFNKPTVRKVTIPTQTGTKKSERAPATQRKASASPITDRRPTKQAPARKVTSAPVKKAPSRTQLAPPRPNTKRKASTPTQQFSSSSEDSSSESEDDLVSRKRVKTSSSLEPDLKRKLRYTPQDSSKDSKLALIHGEDLVPEKDAKAFEPIIKGTDERPIVKLQYPGGLRPERFQLVNPKDSEGYKPLEDIIESVQQICENYFPPDQAETLTDDTSGFPRRLKRAIFTYQSLSDFRSVLDEFNKVVKTHIADGTIPRVLDSNHSLPLPLIERILSQVYSRTVSPRVATLRQYENGTDNVYGELLPRFIHSIFRETHLSSSSVFVDLGSGVGNVVLQAALETGAESWGIEMMKNCCVAGDLQVEELKSRAKLWGLNLGPVRLLSGDFLSTPEIDAVLRRADVVLVNNQAFTADLNDKLVMKFLDLKEGAKIVSLKSFVVDHKITTRNVHDPRNLLRSVSREYFSGSVSWTDRGGEFHIATKDSSILTKFLKKEGLD